MKRIFSLLMLLNISGFLPGQDLPSYLESASRTYSFIHEQAAEINGYFDDIEKILSQDISAAARNYLTLLKKHHNATTSDGTCIVPVFTRVFTLILRNPELRGEFARLYGATAQQRLETASDKGDIEGIREVADLYLPTEAGAEAIRYLSLYYLDHGDLDTALYYSQQLTGENERDHSRLISEMIQKLGSRNEDSAGIPLNLSSLDGSHPRWIGGVSLSTVYPGDLQLFTQVQLRYHLRVGDSRIAVSNGSDLYVYSSATGKHLWSPGPWHSPRPVSRITGGDEYGPDGFDRYQYGGIFNFPAGRIFGNDEVTGSVFNKTDTPNRLVLFENQTGKTFLELTEEVLKSILKGKDNSDERMDLHVGFRPVLCGDVLYFTIHVFGNRRERCFIAKYNIGKMAAEWVTEVFDSNLLQYRTARPRESILLEAEGCIFFFSYAGYSGVCRKSDGVFLWRRSLLPSTGKRYGQTEQEVLFSPVFTAGKCLIEWPEKNTVSALNLYNGKSSWNITLPGQPLWGLETGDSAVISYRTRAGAGLISLDTGSGETRWQNREGSRFPGTVSGSDLLVAGPAGCVGLNIQNGEVTARLKLEGCLYPGSIFTDGKTLYLVNNAGIFAYGPERE